MSGGRLAPQRQFPLVPIVVLALFLGFFALILLTWEAPAPLARIEKVLPASALDGGRSAVGEDGLTEPTLRFVGALAQPLEQVQEIVDIAPEEDPDVVPGGLDLNAGPIVIDGRSN